MVILNLSSHSTSISLLSPFGHSVIGHLYWLWEMGLYHNDTEAF